MNNNMPMTITSLLAKLDQINAWNRDYKQYEQDYYAEVYAYKQREKDFLICAIVECVLPLVYKFLFHNMFLFATMIVIAIFLFAYGVSIIAPIVKSHNKLKNHSNSYENLIISLMGTNEFSLRIDEIAHVEYNTFIMGNDITKINYEVLIDLGDGFKQVGYVESLESMAIDSNSTINATEQ